MPPTPTSSTLTTTHTPPPKPTFYPNEGIVEGTHASRKPSKTILDIQVPTVIVWRNVALFVYLHAAAVYGAFLLLKGEVMWQTFMWATLFYFASGLGITAGCHRLWAHKSYKAKLPLSLLLTVFQTIAFQNSIHEWSRDHRVHHKYSETHADPHNAKRGFFFAHMGWLMCKKHPAVKEKGKGIYMGDLEEDKVVMFQKKWYLPLVLLFCFLLPTMVPMYCWGESLTVSWFFGVQFRFCVILHWTWLVNSAAHMWGNRPYDKTINPSQNKTVAILAMGEGWHNYHHTFPWDYKTAELGHYQYNITAAFIDFMAWIGWAYDLKTVPKNVVLQRVARTGDGTHEHEHSHDGTAPWGWGDKDVPEDDKNLTERLHKLEDESILECSKLGISN